MHKLSEKQLLALTIGVTVLLAGGLGFLIWKDLQAVGAEERRTAELNELIAAAQQEIDQIPAREFRAIANREIADKEVAFLPEETEIETFWEVLERYADESGVQISKISPKQQPTSGRKKPASAIENVDQVLSLRGTVDELLRYLNLIENYDRIINVVEFSITTGASKPDEDGKVRHSINLALRTFTYSKKIANTIVSIANYEKKKDHVEVKQWLSKIKIEEKESYSLRPAIDRRDPFVDVRREPSKVADVDDPIDRKAQEAILLNLVDQVRTLQEMLDLEDHLRAIKDWFRLGQVMKENREMYRAVEAHVAQVEREKQIRQRDLQEQFRTDVVAPFNAVRERIGALEAVQPKLDVAQTESWVKRLRAKFDERDFKAFSEIYREWGQVSRNGEWVDDAARPMVAEIVELNRRVNVIQEFDKRKIVISSVVYNPNGTSLAYVNGKLMAQGDALDGDGKVLVLEIGENYVIFHTEGVEIKRLLKVK